MARRSGGGRQVDFGVGWRLKLRAVSRPLVSFVVPHRNHGEDLGGCVASCVAGYSGPLEVVVVDDASDDGSLAVARAVTGGEERARLIERERQGGVEAAINLGLAATRGEYVVFRAADDRCLPGFLDAAVELLEAEPRAAYCVGDLRFFVEDEGAGRLERSGVPGPARYVTPEGWNASFGGEGLTVAAAVARREAVVAAGGMPEELRWLSDWGLMVELGFQRGMVYLPRPSCAMKVHGGSYNSVGSANAAANRQVLRLLLRRLAGRGEALASAVEASRVLGFLRSGLTGLGEDGLGLEERRLRASGLAERPEARSRCGMPLALRGFLEESRAALLSAAGVAILGAGGHTRLLLEQWRRLGLPEPVAVLASDAGGAVELGGVPVREIGAARREAFDTVVVSSKSYESELARLAAEAFPKARALRVWGGGAGGD